MALELVQCIERLVVKGLGPLPLVIIVNEVYSQSLHYILPFLLESMIHP